MRLSKEQFSLLSRRKLLQGGAVLFGQFLLSRTMAGVAFAQEVPNAVDESLELYITQFQIDEYLNTANASGVGISRPESLSSLEEYQDFLSDLESWGVSKAERFSSNTKMEPTIAAVADKSGMSQLPVALLSIGENGSEFPHFIYHGKMWWYEQVESSNTQVTYYQLKNEDGESFSDYFVAESLQEAVQRANWEYFLDILPDQTKFLRNCIEDNQLFNPEYAFFALLDGYHDSDQLGDHHQVIDTRVFGVDDTLYSTIQSHPTYTPSSMQLLLGTDMFRRVSMEKNSIASCIEARKAEVVEAEKQDQQLPATIVHFPFAMDEYKSQILIRFLEKTDLEFGLERLNMIFVTSISNEDVVAEISWKLRTYIFAVTSSTENRGILATQDSQQRLIEWPEGLPGLDARVVLSKDELDTTEIKWGFAPRSMGGVSQLCVIVTCLLGVTSSVLRSRGMVGTATEIDKQMLQFFDVAKKTRETQENLEYEVLQFNQKKFQQFIEGNQESIHFPFVGNNPTTSSASD